MENVMHQLRLRAQALLSRNTALPEEIASLLQDLAALEEPQIDFREIVDHIDENIFITDGEGLVLYVNPAYSHNTGVPESDVLHRNVRDIVKDGVFSGGSTIPVLETKRKAYRMSTTYRSDTPWLGYTVGVPIFDEQNELKQVVVTSRTIRTLVQLKDEYDQFVSVVKSYTSDNVKIIQHFDSGKREGTRWDSPKMQEIHTLISRVAPTDATVLLTGESGVGKEVVADEIYRLSSRSDKPFVKVNCAAISASLLESELFGYEKGAFSGADAKGKKGLIEMANHGTLLLDEIGEMSVDLQAKLLRVIQNNEIRRVGGTATISLDIRYIAATNRNLKQSVSDGTFRQDLYYRLRVIPIDIPPLRERPSDIAPLCRHFVQRNNDRYHTDYTLTPTQLSLLENYTWPGNVREVENIIEYFTICRTESDKTNDYMLMNLLNVDEQEENVDAGGDMPKALEHLEKQMIEDALGKSKNLREAGQLLHISAPTLSRKIKQYHIDYPRSN
jgi:PAS domain S-box-containing protein